MRKIYQFVKKLTAEKIYSNMLFKLKYEKKFKSIGD